ncbi:MAG TPA: hypothetical protein VFH97_07955, partial [Gemmatimonadales bacterium]|nr:hypothetical protein [Gemmatimonadales bacterium]
MGGLGLDGARARPGAAVGPTIALSLTRWLDFQTEVLYTTYGVWLTDAFAVQTPENPLRSASFRFIQAPLLARLDVARLLHLPLHAQVYGGPHLSAMLTCRLDVATPLAEDVPCGSAPETSPFSDMRTVEAGAVTGAALAVGLFGLFQLATDVRYQRGFSQYGVVAGGLRNWGWAFAVRLSSLMGGPGSAGYIPPPMIQRAPLVPDWEKVP